MATLASTGAPRPFIVELVNGHVGALKRPAWRTPAVTMLSEAECSVQEVASIAGHSLAGAQKNLDSYLSRTLRMADSAIAKLERHPRNMAAKRDV